MKIQFGWHLDGGLPARESALADARMGPLALLQWLEARLGLARHWPCTLERVLAYESVLEPARSGAFYEASFAKDRLAVAEALLAWRDELILSGWDRTPITTGSTRLDVLLQLERRVDPVVQTGLGDRLLAVLETLLQRPIPVASLKVIEERDHLPFLWQRLLDVLGATWHVAATPAPRALAKEGSDLHAVQRLLLGMPQKAGSGMALNGDDSFTICSAFSDLTLGRLGGQELTAVSRAGREVVLLAEGAAAQMDRGMQALNAACAGLAEPSRARAIPQVLALALRLRWRPLDPAHLLEFLTHPVCPVSSGLRWKLVEALRETPGIGGSKWQAAIEAAREQIQSGGDADAAKRNAQLARVEADLDNWILVERFDHNGAADGAKLAETCRRVARWAEAVAKFRESQADAALYCALAADAGQLGRLLTPRAEVRAPLLNRLLGQVLGSGWLPVGQTPELGGPSVIRHPGALVEPTEVLLWWNPSEPQRAQVSPWSTSELTHLRLAGIHPLPATQVLNRETRAWERMVCRTTGRLILLLPRQVVGDPAARHPLLNRLQGLLGKTSLPIVDVDERLRLGQPPMSGSFAAAPDLELPALRRWWRLPTGFTPPRLEESFSSAEKFLYWPSNWVFRYPARLRRGVLAEQTTMADPRLYGNLLHRLTEWLFNEPPPVGLDWAQATDSAIAGWVRGHWQRLLETEGASLLVPGRRTDNARLLAEGTRALVKLVALLREAGAVTARASVQPDARPFCGGKIGGYLDLVVRNAQGRQAVLDLKYGSRADKERQVRAGIALQLAVYGHLLRESPPAQWPAAGFFVLKNRVLLTPDKDFFPQDGQFAAAGFSWEQCWKEFETMWNWRQQLLNEGWVELTLAGAPPTDGTTGEPSSSPPLAHWAPAKDAGKYNDFAALSGFGAGQ